MADQDLKNCRLHVFGHIHEAHGVSVSPLKTASKSPERERVSVNAAMPHSGSAIIVDLLN